MLKAIVSTAAILLLPLLSLPQVKGSYTRPEQVWAVLLKGGGQYTSFAGNLPAATWGRGWFAGVALKIPLKNNWWFQPEIMYDRRTVQLQYPASTGGSAYEVAYTFSYVSYPILLSYRPNDIFEIQAGPQFGAFLANKVEAPANQRSSNLTPNDLHKWNAGLTAGVELNVSPLAFGLRYNQSLSKLASTESAKKELGDPRLHGFQFYGALVF